MATTYNHSTTLYPPNAVGVSWLPTQDMMCQCGMLTTIWLESNFTIGDDFGIIRQCPACHYKSTVGHTGHRMTHMFYAGDDWPIHNLIRRSGYDRERFLSHKYRDHGDDQHINGNNGEATNGDDFAYPRPPNMTYYSKSTHQAYGHEYVVVALGPPHSLVFQSFMDGDTSAQPLITDTTKKSCIQKTELALRPKEVTNQNQPGTGAQEVGTASVRCKHCGGTNTYVLLSIMLIICSLSTDSTYATYLSDHAGEFAQCDFTTTTSSPLFTLPTGVCDFEVSLSYSVASGTGGFAASSCVLYADSTPLISLGLGAVPPNEISALPAAVASPGMDTKNMHYRTICSGEVLTVQTVAVILFPEASETCCSLSWAVNDQQAVQINDTTPVKVNVTATSTIVDVNVTSILGQESNRVQLCNLTAPNGTVTGNYSCIVPKLLEVLPPDTATGPSYLGRPQYYTWTNFSGYRYPNFQPFNASTFNGAQYAPPDPVPVPSLPPTFPPVTPNTSFISRDANTYVTDINDALGSALVGLRRKLAPDNGYSAAKAKSHNKEKHCENGNTVQNMSDDEFRSYCLEAADRHGSLYHYVFNHLAYDEVIPEKVVPVIAQETFSNIIEQPVRTTNKREGSTANRTSSRGSNETTTQQSARRSRNNTQSSNDTQAPKIQYDAILGRIAAKIASWEQLLCYIIRNSGDDLIHLQRIYHRLKFVDDGSAAAGLVCMYLSDSGFKDNIKMRILIERADDILRFSRFSCPLLNQIHTVSGWDEVCALHLNKEMHTMIGNGTKVISADKRTGTQVAPPHITTYYVSPDSIDSENFIDWLAMMTAFDAYFTIGPKYAGDTVAVTLLLANITQTTRIEAHFRLRGGVGEDEQEMKYTPTSAPLTPTPDETGKRNTSATLPKDGIKADDEKSSDGLPSAEILTTSLANTFSATTKWSDSLFYTTVNSLTGLLERYAQSIKLTSSQFNNVGFKSCMNNYGMYFAHFLTRTGEGGTAVGDVYTSVDPSGPGNTTISYTKAGEDLVAAISTNNMLQVSQNLRIQTVPVNGTALYQAMTDSRNVVSCGLNGSFASIFYRIFANMYSSIPMVGTEHAPVVGNTHIVLPAVLTQDWENVYWPLSLAHGAALPIVNTMICTYSEFTGGRFGNLLFSQPQFGPNGYAWGNTTAVVPITLDMLNSQRGGVVAAWILAHMEYPFRRSFYATTLVQDDNTNIAQWDGLGIPSISNSRCRGPIQNVLLVVSGINTVSNALDDFTVTVGTGGGAVLVTYNNNFAVGLGGLQVDIAAGLDSIYQAGVPFQQLWLEALNTAYTCYGNESDVKTAMLMVADSGTRIAPPALTAANLNLYGYVFGTPTGWNSTGLTDISAGNLAHLDGITCPLNMGTTVAIADIRNLSNAVCRIGQFNPLIAVDMVNGMYRPSIPPSQLFPQSTAAIVSCISRLSRMLTVSGDAALRATGLPMNYLFNPAAAQALTAGNVNVLAAWRSIYDGINKVLEDQGVSATYLGSWFADRNSTYWQFFNAAHAALCAIARVPNFYMKYADIPWDAYCPELARTQLFGEYDAANFGFPNVGNPYERIITQAPEQSKSLTPYDILARLSPMFPAAINREPLEFVLMTKGGGSVVPVAFPNMYPSVGRSPALTLQNYGIITYQVVDLVDPPMDGTIPVFNPNVNNEVFPGFYGNSYGYYTRVPQVKYNKHEIANGDLFNYTILQNASGAPSLQNRLTKLSGKKGN